MNKERTILKFDTGADGFMMMIYVLGGLSICLLIAGVYFIVTTF